jgi:hypothetical protein
LPVDNAGPNSHIGFDFFTRQLLLPDTNGDLMSYAHFIPQGRWPSDYTWEGIFNRLNNGVAGLATQPDLEMPTASQTFLASGVISDTTVFFNHAYALTGALLADATQRIADQTIVSPDYELRAYDANDNLLGSTPLTVMDLEDLGSSDVPFFTLIGLDAQPARLEVVEVGGGTLGTLTAGAASPTLSITSPAPGATVGSWLTVAWQGSDPDGDLLRYVVRYSPDNGASWIALDASDTGNRLVINTDDGLPGGAMAWVEVIASDGLHTTTASAGPFSAPTHAPGARIYDAEYDELNDVMTAAAAQSEVVVLNGDGYDAEDGPLSGAALQWQVTGPVSRSGSGSQLL